MSIDDYLDSLLSGSSAASKKAIMKLTKLIENIGSIMIKSTERIEDVISELEQRISVIEQHLGLSRGQPGSAPSIPKAPTAGAPTSSAPQVSAPVASPPSAAKAPSTIPAPATASGSVSPPSFGGGSSSSPSGPIPAPSLNNPGGSTSASPAPVAANPLGLPNLASEIASAAKSLKKVEKPATPTPGGGPSPRPAPGGAPGLGPLSMQAELKSVLAKGRDALEKIDPEKIKKEKQSASSTGSMPPSFAMQSELRAALQKRSQKKMEAAEAEEQPMPTTPAPTTPKKSSKQMKAALQNELKAAFNRLLESDTEE
ncbi:MAG: hypothetical protein ACTSYD_14470 [Candidatus Heimdallarchaeaceae archaeon]